jgi:hypothetical protein
VEISRLPVSRTIDKQHKFGGTHGLRQFWRELVARQHFYFRTAIGARQFVGNLPSQAIIGA